jgi:hypothetical protein
LKKASSVGLLVVSASLLEEQRQPTFLGAYLNLRGIRTGENIMTKE